MMEWWSSDWFIIGCLVTLAYINARSLYRTRRRKPWREG